MALKVSWKFRHITSKWSVKNGYNAIAKWKEACDA